MRWVTRARPVIDRIACPWLIARFIDEAPEFLFVPPERVLAVAEETGAVPYDVPGVELTHVGEGCSFDTFLAKYGLDDPALRELARIVRGADTERLDLTPQSAGLLAVSLGLRSSFGDDHEVLARLRALRRALPLVSRAEGRDPRLAARDDLAQQLHAVESAVAGAKRELIHDHVEHCLDDTAEAGDVRAALKEFRTLAKYL